MKEVSEIAVKLMATLARTAPKAGTGMTILFLVVMLTML